VLAQGGGIIASVKNVLGYETPAEQQQTMPASDTTAGTQVDIHERQSPEKYSLHAFQQAELVTNMIVVCQVGMQCCFLQPFDICIAAFGVGPGMSQSVLGAHAYVMAACSSVCSLAG